MTNPTEPLDISDVSKLQYANGSNIRDIAKFPDGSFCSRDLLGVPHLHDKWGQFTGDPGLSEEYDIITKPTGREDWEWGKPVCVWDAEVRGAILRFYAGETPYGVPRTLNPDDHHNKANWNNAMPAEEWFAKYGPGSDE